jgi:G3E family GTPase
MSNGDAPGFLVLTGFLGAGKTTVLNRVLGDAHAHGRRVAVLVNELGRIDIDTRLIRSRAGDVMELAGGCVCHEVAVLSEMWDATNDVVRRSSPELVILETTGIAEPGAIVTSFLARPDHAVPLRFRGVVTVADAEATPSTLTRFAEARAQVEEADRILVSKTDIASPSALAATHGALGALNPGAERAAFPTNAEGTAALVRWLLDEPPRRPRSGVTVGAPHAHTHQLAAATFVDDGPLLRAPLLQLMTELGPQLVRAKGFVRVHGENQRHFLEHASGRTKLEAAGAWPGVPRTELVVIGTGLDELALRRRLWACRASTVASGGTN